MLGKGQGEWCPPPYNRLTIKTLQIMRIYVGRWDLLPEDWEGINGLYEKSEDEIRAEIGREIGAWADKSPFEDNLMGCYTEIEFEEEFNGNDGSLNGVTYFIKIFV